MYGQGLNNTINKFYSDFGEKKQNTEPTRRQWRWVGSAGFAVKSIDMIMVA